MDLKEAKELWESAGYIVEDTDDWDEADREQIESRSISITNANNFNIKNLFYGVEKELEKVYKKVEMSQLVRYYIWKYCCLQMIQVLDFVEYNGYIVDIVENLDEILLLKMWSYSTSIC